MEKTLVSVTAASLVTANSSKTIPKSLSGSSFPVSLQCSNVDLIFQQGFAFHERGDLANALHHYRQAIALDPNHAGTLHALGLIDLQQGQYQKACDSFEKAVTFCPTKAIYKSNYGVALLKLGKRDEAKNILEVALNVCPDHPDVLYNLGITCFEREEYGRTTELLEQLLHQCDYPQAIPLPVDRTTLNVKIKAKDDNIVEKLYETLAIGILSAKNQSNSSVNYTFDAYDPKKEDPSDPTYNPTYVPPLGSVVKFQIKDNDTLDLQKVVFQGVRASFQSDPDPSTGSTISWVYHSMLNPNVSHWWKGKQLDKNPSVGYVPVAYSSQNQLQANAFWANTQIDPNIINDLYVYFEVDINGVRKSNDVKLVNSGGTLNMGSALAELAQTFETYQGKKAVYDPGFTLIWKFYVGADGNTKTRAAGASTSCLYVTYGNPATSNLFHTVVHTGAWRPMGWHQRQVVMLTSRFLTQFGRNLMGKISRASQLSMERLLIMSY